MLVNCINNIIQETTFSYPAELSTILLQPLPRYIYSTFNIYEALDLSCMMVSIGFKTHVRYIYIYIKTEVLLKYWSDIYPQLQYSINNH